MSDRALAHAFSEAVAFPGRGDLLAFSGKNDTMVIRSRRPAPTGFRTRPWLFLGTLVHLGEARS
jgi:hypothetical protein